MTFREKLMMEHPDNVNPRWWGGCSGCPYAYMYEFGYGLCEGGDYDKEMCTKCWGREIPEDAKTQERVETTPEEDMVKAASDIREAAESVLDGVEKAFSRDAEPISEGIKRIQKTWDELKSEVLPTTKDPVNHPGHYESGKFECIDVMLETQGKEAVMGFCICNAFKYLYRYNRKNGIEDVKKAQWYINKFLELAEEKNE